MNEFEWLRQARALNTTHHPDRDLWPDIAARITGARSRPTRTWLPWMSVAAMLVLSLLGAGTALYTQQILKPSSLAAAAPAPRWKPADPRLVGAAIEFEAANSELRLAMQQEPGARYLQQILARTQAQQQRLQRYRLSMR
jgi:hypothetical protein